MKTKNLVSAMLFAFTVVLNSCSEDDEPVTQSCLPIEMPGEDGMMKLSYNDQNVVTQVEYLEYGNEDPGRFIQKLYYTDGKLTKTESYDSEVLEGYSEFVYTEAKIIENVFRLSGEEGFTKNEFYTYYLESGKITKIAWKDIKYTGYDSALYMYDAAGSITNLKKYNSDKELLYSSVLEHDNKPNPYKVSGISAGDGGFFEHSNLSNNNWVKATTQVDGDSESETMLYTYDTNGNLITRKYDGGTTRSYKYNCK